MESGREGDSEEHLPRPPFLPRGKSYSSNCYNQRTHSTLKFSFTLSETEKIQYYAFCLIYSSSWFGLTAGVAICFCLQESFMTPVNPFIKTNKEKMIQCLDELAVYGNLYASMPKLCAPPSPPFSSQPTPTPPSPSLKSALPRQHLVFSFF